jgi:hypothetical protein
VSIADKEPALNALREQVVPGVQSAPGFVSGTWVHVADESSGFSTVLFDSEQNARDFAAGFNPPADAPVTLESAYVGEVVAQA